MAPTTVIAFDLYGTLLSTESIARELAGLYGDGKARTIAAQARRYQLEYTWRINSMGESLAGSSRLGWACCMNNTVEARIARSAT